MKGVGELIGFFFLHLPPPVEYVRFTDTNKNFQGARNTDNGITEEKEYS